MPLPKRKIKAVRTISATPRKLRTYLPVDRQGKTNTELVIPLTRSKDYTWIIEKIKRELPYKKKTAMPENLKPMLASSAEAPFNDKDWQFEIKWDGYRALSYISNGKTKLLSRNNLPFDHKFPPIAEALKQWPINAVVDGEVVVLSKDGKADFGAIQSWESTTDGDLFYFVFDIIWLEGYDLKQEPLSVRRDILRKIVPESGCIRFSESIDEYGTSFFEAAKNNGLEGIIAKQKHSTYNPGNRTQQWYKIKAEKRQEALICGYTKKKDSPRLISSLLLGVPNNGTLEYIGQVGTGFNNRIQQVLFNKMNPLFTSTCPFATKPVTGAPTMWVEPQLVCEVKFTEFTADGLMRHPSFQGLREDKTAKDINIEAGLVNPEAHLNKNGTESTLNVFTTQDEGTAEVVVDGHALAFTNLTKLYWPKEKITKGAVLNYYNDMAAYIMPYMQDRPQSLNRFPNGITGKSFYQKNMKGKVEPWLKTFVRYNESDKEGTEFLVCTNTASLLYMANLGCIEMNPWHSRTSASLYPDWCVIDLDPGTIAFSRVIQTANMVQCILSSLGIPSYPKTSGSTGIHIYIPLGAKYNYEQSRQLAELIATLVHNELPSFTSLVRNPEKRKDKIYIDYLQNRPIQTICAPYSIRPKPGATVSAPLHWDEVKTGLKINQFTMLNMAARVKSEGDLFKGVMEKGIDLNEVLKSLSLLL